MVLRCLRRTDTQHRAMAVRVVYGPSVSSADVYLEVCGTAIETPMRVSVRLTVLDGPEHAHVQSPHFLTSSAPPHPSSSSSTETYYTTTGVEPALLPAAQAATRAMLAALAAQHALSAEHAYMLCSVAGDLRLHEVVDMPNFVVRARAWRWRVARC
jgi:acetamidase/formamidase